MSTTLAPNKQAERSLDEQSIVVPADIRQSAIQSPAVLAHDPDQQRMDLKVVRVHKADARVIDVDDPAPRNVA